LLLRPCSQRPFAGRGYVVRLHHRYYALIRQSDALSPISYYRLIRRVFVIQGQILTAHQTFPNLLCVSFPTCRHPYPGGSHHCFCLFLHDALRSFQRVQRFDTRFLCPRHFLFRYAERTSSLTRLQCSLTATAYRFARPTEMAPFVLTRVWDLYFRAFP
jgi:hypothetical protein